MTVGIASGGAPPAHLLATGAPGARQMYDFTGTEIDLDAIRKRIVSLPDEELVKYGKERSSLRVPGFWTAAMG